MLAYDILQETFCLYCQVDLETTEALQAHVEQEHPNTYASVAIMVAKEKA